MKRVFHSLLFWVLIAILLGIACSFFLPVPLARVFATYNSLFGNFLNFFVPVLIFALITPAIAGLGRGAGKWLALTTDIAYISTILAGFLAYTVARGLYPRLLPRSEVAGAKDIAAGQLQPYFTIEMPAPVDVMTSLLLAFCMGVAMTAVNANRLYHLLTEFQDVVMKVITSFVIPLLPPFIFGMFLDLGMNGNLAQVLVSFGEVLLISVVLTVIYLLFQYLVAGSITHKNPFTALGHMLPAYAMALGTSSSAATIPVTYRCALTNGVDKNVAGFTIPLCATIHLAGSMTKITLYAFAVVWMTGLQVSPAQAVGFILMLGITMVAAPGVPGGAIMAATGLLTSMLGFNDSAIALMIAAYIAVDSFGTAANVTGDGAIALVMDRLARGRINVSNEDEINNALRGRGTSIDRDAVVSSSPLPRE
ncbi:dicarboxylate/amino acid:cation symporter [Neoactinobaculum massilliense]|uniref:dicarboxylate/amino acid:cation symporter n=1 Tax=Neoactinobaculum massilliense TaxID=2364794 RepID=UPI000F53AD48|nr:dicarboxylate/amino acid:cation symporter [Neoactinobaculum massilliense]